MGLRIFHLNAERGWRGGEQQLASLVDMLSTSGVTNFVGTRRNSRIETHCIDKQIPVVPLRFGKLIELGTAFRIRTFCKRNKIDLIHVHSAGAHLAAVLAAVLGNPIPVVLSRRVDFLPKKSWLTRWKYNHACIARIVGVSEAITKIMRGYVDKPEKCITIYSGVDRYRFAGASKEILRSRFTIDPEKIIVGSVAALEAHKDHVTFLNTIAVLRARGVNVHGVIIGDGSMRDMLEAYTSDRKLANHVLFAGYRTDVTELLPGFDVFLMTSKQEGLGTSVLDAFASGVPVVATAAGGIPEMVIHRQSGMLSPIGNAESLADSVQQVVDDPVLRDSIVAGGFFMVKRFTREATAHLTLELYHAIADKYSEAPRR